jgi:hypothetical protein
MFQSAPPIPRLRRWRAPAVDRGALARFGVVLACLASAALAIGLSERRPVRDLPLASKATHIRDLPPPSPER